MKTKPRTASKVYRRPAKRKPAKPTAAIVVQVPDPKPWLLSLDEVTILKNAVCKGASDDELKYCLTVARRYRLDPFRKQIWFTPRWDSQAEHTDGQKGARLWVPIVGIDGLLHVAARDHADFGTFSEVEYGPMIDVEWTDKYDKGKIKKIKAPEWARIEAWKKGCEHPTVAKVFWEEIYPNVDSAPMVRRMSRLMLGKCAKANATRTAYPETGGLLIQEETHSREFQDITPGGRVFAPVQSGGSVAAAQAIGQRIIEEKKAQIAARSTAASPAAPVATALHKEAQTVDMPTKPEGSPTAAPVAKPAPKTEAAFDAKAAAAVKGKAVKIYPLSIGGIAAWAFQPEPIEPLAYLLDHGLKDIAVFASGAKRWYVVDDQAVLSAVRKVSAEFGITIEAVTGPGPMAPPAAVVPPPPKGIVTAAPEPPPTGDTATIQSAHEKVSEGGKIRLIVMFGGKPHSVWARHLWPAIQGSIGQSAEFVVKTKGEWRTITGIKRIGKKEYVDDAPVRSMDDMGQSSFF